jgi:hypothetical protein
MLRLDLIHCYIQSQNHFYDNNSVQKQGGVCLPHIRNSYFGWLQKEDSPTPDIPVKLDDHYQGGIVFYVDGTGKHGLIAAAMDQAATDPWWNGTFVTTNATSLTAGKTNTTSIISAQGNTGTYAAKLCRDYKGGGFSDWYLPAKDQLNTLYAQKNLVGGFVSEIYWSSSEFDTAEVWVQDFTDGTQHTDNTSDGANVHTRAIRDSKTPFEQSVNHKRTGFNSNFPHFTEYEENMDQA